MKNYIKKFRNWIVNHLQCLENGVIITIQYKYV